MCYLLGAEAARRDGAHAAGQYTLQTRCISHSSVHFLAHHSHMPAACSFLRLSLPSLCVSAVFAQFPCCNVHRPVASHFQSMPCLQIQLAPLILVQLGEGAIVYLVHGW